MKITIIYGPRIEEVKKKGAGYLKRFYRWIKENDPGQRHPGDKE